jgi:hypothetical protein
MGADDGRNSGVMARRVQNRASWFRQAMAGTAMVLACPSESLVPRFSADPLAKCRKLGKACGIILFKRLQFSHATLGPKPPTEQ